MISKKYNPLSKKGKKTNKKSSHSNKSNMNTNITLVLLVILIIAVLMYFNILPFDFKLSSKNTQHHNTLNINNNDGFDINKVPSGDKLIEGFEDTTTTTTQPIPTTTKYQAKYIVNGDPEAELAFLNLDKDDQNRLCSNKLGETMGYRNAATGATFRFQKIDPTTSQEHYFLLASIDDGKVITVDDNDNLKLVTKSSTDDNQHFLRKQIVIKSGRRTVETDDYYFIPLTDENETRPRALQYEFEHLSLRLVKEDNTPYEGQKFTIMTPEEQDTVNIMGLSYNEGTPHLNSGDLTEGFVNSNGPLEIKLKVNVNPTTEATTNLDAFNNLLNGSLAASSSSNTEDVRTLLNNFNNIFL